VPILPADFDRSLLMSMRGYARRRGVSAMTVHQAVKAGRLVQCVATDEAGKFLGITDPFLADKEWAENTDVTKAPPKEQAKAAARARVLGGAPAEPDGESLANASAREKFYAAELKKLKFLEASRVLVPAAEVKARLVDEYSACRTRLLAIPSRAKQALPELTVAHLAVIEGLIREALEDLADAEAVAAVEARPDDESGDE
jgi:hypothetical protein